VHSTHHTSQLGLRLSSYVARMAAPRPTSALERRKPTNPPAPRPAQAYLRSTASGLAPQGPLHTRCAFHPPHKSTTAVKCRRTDGGASSHERREPTNPPAPAPHTRTSGVLLPASPHPGDCRADLERGRMSLKHHTRPRMIHAVKPSLRRSRPHPSRSQQLRTSPSCPKRRPHAPAYEASPLLLAPGTRAVPGTIRRG